MKDRNRHTEQQRPSISQIGRIDDLCGDFESQWRAGANPRIENYLARVSAPLRSTLLTELIALEIDLQEAGKEQSKLDDYHQRFPSNQTAVEAGWKLIVDRNMRHEEALTTIKVPIDGKRETGGNTPAVTNHADESAKSDGLPTHIGRYQIVKILGEGGFGRVYLALDLQLQRQVALKVAGSRWLESETKVEMLLHEARLAANLKHPALVTVHDIQQEGENVYIIQEYVDGKDLGKWAESNRPSRDQIVQVIMEIAQAIGFAHQQDLVHRDLKPGNILIDLEGHAHVADFGLALKESVHRLRKGEVSGTPAYMSPEQVRGETHLTDGRSDLWSIGVILYELLTERRPFRGDTLSELFDEIEHRDPKPLRQIKPKLSSELDRICSKCLQKRRTDRYGSAAELTDDLQAWLEPPTPVTDSASATHPTHLVPRPPSRVVPKGLRSFDGHDADFFLQLLPGARDRDGLPESIRFWKTRIEQTDPNNTFAVGLIYGPSGCGKSSLVKAGLLPRLAPHITPFYVEVTPEDTEFRLSTSLRRRVEGIPDDVELPELLAGLRVGRWRPEGEKTLIVLDQFEQWLHAWHNKQDTDLVRALRHCDGVRLQCIVLVRDDFWLAASRFLQDLEVRLLEGNNTALVDLFDPLHARMVLAEFGRAYGRLPDEATELSDDQNLFLDRAVEGLAHEGMIICVRLALFADMLKGKPWSTDTLTRVGGTEGLGATFLEETFGVSTAPAAHRYHQRAAQEVLKALLPDTGIAIRGSRLSYTELLGASGYESRKQDFQDLIRILDSELRLITPTVARCEDIETGNSNGDRGKASEEKASKTRNGEDTDSRQSQSGSGSIHCGDGAGKEALCCAVRNRPPATCRYQLTHDYLVPSLRKWLTHKQQETRRGRAELRLAERAMQWGSRPENRYLPTAWEDLNIRLLTRRNNWSESQRRMMHKSGRWHGMRTLVVTCLILIATVTSGVIRNSILAERRRIEVENLEKRNVVRASGLVTAVMKADIQQLPTVIEEMNDYRQWADPILRRQYQLSQDSSPEQLKLALALLAVDSSQVEFLFNRLLAANPNEIVIVRDALLPHKHLLVARLWRIMQKADPNQAPRQLRAACALAVMDEKNPQWQQMADRVARQMVHVRPAFLAYWQQALRPVKSVLAPSLAGACHDSALTSTERTVATDLLVNYAAASSELLATAIQYADNRQFDIFFPLIEAQSASAIPVLKSCLAEKLPVDWQDRPVDPVWQTPEASVIQRIQDAQGRLLDRFAFCQTMPLPDFLNVAKSLRACGYRPMRLRPYHSGGKDINVAAIWSRDDNPWRIKIGTVDEIRTENKRLRADEWQAIDIAGFMAPGERGKPALLFAALWNQGDGKDPARQLLVGLPSEDWPTVRQLLDKAELRRVHCYNVLTTPEGKTLISVISSKDDSRSFAYDEIGAGYSGELRPGLLQVDVGIGRSPKRENTRQRYTRQLQAAEQALAAAPDDVSARLRHFMACYHLGKNEQALDDMDRIFATQKNVSARSYHQRRSLLFARLGQKQEAEEEFTQFQKLSTSDGEKVFVKTVVASHLDTGDAAIEQLEQEVFQHKKDPVFLIWAARAFSVVSGIVLDPDKRADYVEKAVDLIQRGIAAGFDNYGILKNDLNLESLDTSPRFVELLKKYELDRRYTAVWIESTSLESSEVHGLAPADQLARCETFAEQGYRPVSIAACNFNAVFGSASIMPDSPNPIVFGSKGPSTLETATVWHRPLIPESTKKMLAKRQANAAVTLLKLNKSSSAWPILRHTSDSRARSYLIHRMHPLHVDPQILASRILDASEEVSVRRALSLSLGEFAAEQLAATQRNSLVKSLLNIYHNHPDPGLHAAVRWLLCHWGHKKQVSELDSRMQETENQLAARQPTDQRQWYVTTQGHTMVVIQGDSFLMGSPLTDLERMRGETLHRKDLDRRFALAATEVTLTQWRTFQQARPEDTNDVMKMPEFRAVVLTGDSPVVAVSWFESAAYCNWLSKQEGIPEEQWCYARNADGRFAAGMRPKPNYLLLRGYRLPSEAEWEYACRAGTTTSRYFGQTNELLTDYAWCKTNSNHHTWPTSSLKPNDFGVFDMHGNVNEWCHDRWTRRNTSMKDVEDAATVQITAARAVRGGSFVDETSLIRSASALGFRPDAHNYTTGFRVARTYR